MNWKDEMFGTGLLRKATKVVLYTALPFTGPLKAATMGTRRGNLNRKEVRKQTALLQQQNALLARQLGSYEQMQVLENGAPSAPVFVSSAPLTGKMLREAAATQAMQARMRAQEQAEREWVPTAADEAWLQAAMDRPASALGK